MVEKQPEKQDRIAISAHPDTAIFLKLLSFVVFLCALGGFARDSRSQ